MILNDLLCILYTPHEEERMNVKSTSCALLHSSSPPQGYSCFVSSYVYTTYYTDSTHTMPLVICVYVYIIYILHYVRPKAVLPLNTKLSVEFPAAVDVTSSFTTLPEMDCTCMVSRVLHSS